MKRIAIGLALGLACTVLAAPAVYQGWTYYFPLPAPPAAPATPTTGVTLYAEDSVGDWSLLKVLGKHGDPVTMQSHLGRNFVAWAIPAGAGTGTTAPTTSGMGVTHSGTTVANPAPATTNFMTAATRVTSLSGAVAGNEAGWRGAQLRYWRGNGAGLGGFMCTFRWCNESVPASNRGLIGMTNSTAARANQDPTVDLNFVGALWNAADAGISLGGNDGTGTATKTTTCNSTDFPARTNNQCFELIVTAKQNASQFVLVLKRLDAAVTDCTATITASADMPANTALLAPRVGHEISSTTTDTIALLRLYCESDY